ncbi:GNAT family N-acetyltransferase [Pseudomonas sp. SCB32]|uniref:GNAT family N-acetyltransferase n=1 Tax=Pseudomonas sp. SCB32 TaxID=2653853 RepID=UPI0012645E70|nr:GNAT family N-acetyltransferase [Pseudomonas sp. SCB32]
MNTFDDQPTLIGEILQLRPLRADDLDALHAAASDPRTWAGHPATERYRREVFEPYFQFLVQAGGCLLILDRTSGQAIGCSRYYPVPDQPDDIGIGFTFINHRYWGGVTNRELKTLMLSHAFQHFARVWFHIAPSNIRSQKGTAKLGAELAYEAALDLSGTPEQWLCYVLPRERWAARAGSQER